LPAVALDSAARPQVTQLPATLLARQQVLDEVVVVEGEQPRAARKMPQILINPLPEAGFKKRT
jgi:hypothetical protein